MVGPVTTDRDAAPWAGARLHVVTGKGGTGKTTVASALALALASAPGHVLLTEVEGRQGISQTFDVPPLGTEETRILRLAGGGEVVGLSIDPKAALLEYLQLFYKLGRAGRLLEKFGAIDFATTIAPGVRDVLLIGKIYEANRRRRDGRHKGDAAAAYDALVLDAPPTGPHRPLPLRQLRGGRPRAGRSDPLAGRLDHAACSSPTADGRPPRHPARGDARAGDPRVDRRAARQGPAPRARSSSTWCASRCSTTPRSTRPATGRLHKPSIRTQLAEAGVTRDARARRRACSRRPATTPSASTSSASSSPSSRPPGLPIVAAARPARAASTRARCASSPTCSSTSGSSVQLRSRRGRMHEPGHAVPTPAPVRSTSTPLIADPSDRDRRLLRLRRRRQDDDRRGARAARRRVGPPVVVLTIDPARRLAQSLGLTELDNTPRPVTDIDTSSGRQPPRDDARHEADLRRGRHRPLRARQGRADPRQPLLPGRQQLLRRHAGVHGDGEARPAQGERRHRGRPWDLIVVDTPPSRSALDFLDAPNRLGSFLDGRFIRLLTAPAKAGGRAGLKVFGLACSS